MLAGAAHAAGTTNERILLVVGDSLSAGYGIKVEDGWVALLRQRLQAEGYGYRVVNASVTGETSSGGRARLPALLRTHKPAVVVLELGANDGLRGLPPQGVQDNLAAMIEAAQSSQARVLLAGMQIPTNYGETYTQRFNAVFGALQQRYRVALVPFFLDKVALDVNLMQADELHPNAKAQKLLLDNVWPHLRPLLQRKQG